MNEKRYNDLYHYLMSAFGERLDKICIDGGFTCPNRDGRCGTGGCIFCGSEGAGEFSEHGDIRSSVLRFLDEHDHADKIKSNKFILYFQSYTGTYAPTEVLKEKYDAALCDDRIKILAIGTRPDCISEETLRLLKSYTKKYQVWIELGLQTANDETAHTINRGYDLNVFIDSVHRLKAAGITIITHLMVGLPGENHEDIIRDVSLVNSLPIDGVKIHSLYVMKNTRMEEEYLKGRYTPLTMDGYLEELIWMLRHLRKDIVIHRVTGDCARRTNVAPIWAERKRLVLTAINQKMESENALQGDRINEVPTWELLTPLKKKN